MDPEVSQYPLAEGWAPAGIETSEGGFLQAPPRVHGAVQDTGLRNWCVHLDVQHVRRKLQRHEFIPVLLNVDEIIFVTKG